MLAVEVYLDLEAAQRTLHGDSRDFTVPLQGVSVTKGEEATGDGDREEQSRARHQLAAV